MILVKVDGGVIVETSGFCVLELSLIDVSILVTDQGWVVSIRDQLSKANHLWAKLNQGLLECSLGKISGPWLEEASFVEE